MKTKAPKSLKNSLLRSNPKVAKEAFGWDPSQVTFGHSEKKPWKCSLGHIWNAYPYSRTGKLKKGCPYCAGKAVWIGFNDLNSSHPKVAKQAFGWDPRCFTAGSKKIMKWKCAKGHLFDSRIQNRALKNTGCPACLGRLVIKGFNDLLTVNPRIAKEAHGWDPSKYKFNSKRNMAWICSLNHVFFGKIIERSSQKDIGCLVCLN
jgi:hypothetical protein